MAKSSKTASKKGSGKRELIAPNDDKRYIKRDAKIEYQKVMTRVNR